MSILKFTANKAATMFLVLIAVVLITSFVVSWNIELSLENQIRQWVVEDIARNPSLCYEFSSMQNCIEYLVNQKLGK